MQTSHNAGELLHSRAAYVYCTAKRRVLRGSFGISLSEYKPAIKPEVHNDFTSESFEFKEGREEDTGSGCEHNTSNTDSENQLKQEKKTAFTRGALHSSEDRWSRTESMWFILGELRETLLLYSKHNSFKVSQTTNPLSQTHHREVTLPSVWAEALLLVQTSGSSKAVGGRTTPPRSGKPKKSSRIRPLHRRHSRGLMSSEHASTAKQSQKDTS